MQRSSGREWGGSVAILSQTPDPRALRHALDEVVARSPRLRDRPLRRGLALGTSAAGDAFDLDYHLRWESFGSNDDVMQVMTQRFFEPLAEDRPPWELHVFAAPSRALLLVKMDRRLAPASDPAPLLSALVHGSEVDDPSVADHSAAPTLENELPGVAESLSQAGDALLGAMRTLQSSQTLLLDSVAALVGAARQAQPTADFLTTAARRAAKALASTLTAPIANPLPSALIGSVAGSLRLALVDLPSAALDAARAPFGLELDDVLVSIGAATMARLERQMERQDSAPAGRARHKDEPLRALIASRPRSQVVLSGGASDPIENARAVRRLLTETQEAVRAKRARRTTESPAVSRRRKPYDLSVCFDRSPLAGQRLAGAELLRVYPIDSTPRRARLAIGAQRCGDGLALGLTFSTSIAREPAQVLEAFEMSSAEFVEAARSAPAAAAH